LNVPVYLITYNLFPLLDLLDQVLHLLDLGLDSGAQGGAAAAPGIEEEGEAACQCNPHKPRG
jgi:hypothetical protein